jgi:hypothetical protein
MFKGGLKLFFGSKKEFFLFESVHFAQRAKVISSRNENYQYENWEAIFHGMVV